MMTGEQAAKLAELRATYGNSITKVIETKLPPARVHVYIKDIDGYDPEVETTTEAQIHADGRTYWSD